MDLQDLGYETCGRSENEAEREDASSPGDKLLLLLFNLIAILIQTLLIVISIGVREVGSVQPLLFSFCNILFIISPQSLMIWRCAHRCLIIRTMRVLGAAGTLTMR